MIPKIFASLAAIMIGVGSLGNLAGAAPPCSCSRTNRLAFFYAISWLVKYTVICWFILFCQKPRKSRKNFDKGSFFDLLKIRQLWFIFPLVLIHYAPVAGIRGLWIGPYINDNFYSASNLAFATTAMSLAMIAGTFAYGPMDRIFGTRKWIIFIGSSLSLVSLISLALFNEISFNVAVFLFCNLGFLECHIH